MLSRVGCDVDVGHQGLVSQPFKQAEPLTRVVKGESVGIDSPHRTGVGPAQQPVFSVGQDAHPDALAQGLGLQQVVVQLLDVRWVGVVAAGGADAALHFDEGVVGRQVYGAPGGV